MKNFGRLMARIKRSLRGDTRKGHRRRKTGQLSQKKVKIVVVAAVAVVDVSVVVVIIEKERSVNPFRKIGFFN